MSWVARAVVLAATAFIAVNAWAAERVLILIGDADPATVVRTIYALERVTDAFGDSLKERHVDVLGEGVVYEALGVLPKARTSNTDLLKLSAQANATGREDLAHSHVAVLTTEGASRSIGFANVIGVQLSVDLYAVADRKSLGGFTMTREDPVEKGVPVVRAVAAVASRLTDDLAAWLVARLAPAGPQAEPITPPDPPFTGHPSPMLAPMTYVVSFTGIEPDILQEMITLMETEFPHFIAARPPEGTGGTMRYGYVSKAPPHKIFTWMHHLCNDVGLRPGVKVSIDQPTETKLVVRRSF